MVLPVALLLLARRVWLAAAVAGMAAGVALGSLHAAAVEQREPGPGVHELTVELTAASRQHHSATGTWWTAEGVVIAGAARSRVSLTASGEMSLNAGDRITAPMLATTSTRPGESARLRIRGSPHVQPADTLPVRVRATMRELAGDTDPGWLLSGMTIGTDEGLSPAADEQMQAAGLSHLTAVSGANCAILLVLVLWLCGWLRIGRVARVVIALVVLAGFVTVVGPQPSILRASVMASLALVAGVVGGRRAAAHILQVSVLLLLLIDPWLAYSIGFMLSIAATAGLIAALDRGPLAATVAAQVATFPILLAIGGAVGIKTVIANVLVTPLAAVIPVVGLGALAAQGVAGWGAPVAALGRRLTSMVLAVAGLPIDLPLTWVPGWAGVGLAAAVALVVFTAGRRHVVISAAVLIAVVSLVTDLADGWPPRGWWLVACDVGQGDGFVVRSGTATMVVDTGPDPDVMDQCLRRLGVRSVDLLVITHFHADHVAGVRGVLRGRGVGAIWVSPCTDPPEQAGDAMAAIGSLPVHVPRPGEVYRLGEATLNVVWPQRIINAGSIPNNASVTFVLHAPQARVAFLGDIENDAQAAILRTADLRAEVVKVPHHGSAKFDPRLPAAVDPQLALIGVGAENTFGHPTPEALAAWQAVGAQVLTTMDNGDIALTDDAVVVSGVSRPPAR